MRYSDVFLRGVGYQLPPHVLSSSAIEERLAPLYQRLKLPRGRLEMMSGIRERRFWDAGTRPSDGAVLAGRKALEAAGCDPGAVECLIFTSVSRDMMEPATASFVHHQLGLARKCLVFDISNACLGFLDGMVMLANMIELGQVNNGLLVAGETAEALVDSTIRTLLADEKLTRQSIKPSFASLTIGSGAVGLLMGRATVDTDRPRLVGGTYRADTSHIGLCQGGSVGGDQTLMATDSEELLRHGVEVARTTWTDFLADYQWEAADIDVFFCHQVGSAHARLLFEVLKIDPARNFETLSFLGNVGSVSVPITMAMGMEQQAFGPGLRAAMLGIGSGINCLMLGLEW